MRAAVYHGVGDVRLEDVAEPTPGAGQVKLRVAYNGLCGTDLHEVFDGQRAVPSEPHPLTGACAPLILGHEIAGTVVSVGDGVDGVEIGSLVAVEPLWRCGACPPCLAGHANLCDRLAFHGLSTGGGGLGEHTVVPAYMLHATPPGLAPEAAAMAEPLAVAAHAVNRSGVQHGQTAVVLGGGPIGIGILLTLRLRGVEVVGVVEPSAERRSVLAGLGAAVFDPGAGSVVDHVRDLTHGRGTDACFETSGIAASLENALGATAKHGVVMMLASPRHPLAPVLGQALAKELEIRTTYAYNGEFPSVIASLAAGDYPLDGWVTTAAMSDLAATLDAMRAGSLLKVLVDPSA